MFLAALAWFSLHGWHRIHGRWTFSDITVRELRRILKERLGGRVRVRPVPPSRSALL
jgi:hypothetical protein